MYHQLFTRSCMVAIKLYDSSFCFWHAFGFCLLPTTLCVWHIWYVLQLKKFPMFKSVITTFFMPTRCQNLTAVCEIQTYAHVMLKGYYSYTESFLFPHIMFGAMIFLERRGFLLTNLANRPCMFSLSNCDVMNFSI